MEKFDTSNYPRFELPEGFYYSKFKSGLVVEWAKLQLEVEQTETQDEAEEIFYREFLIGKPYNWSCPEKNEIIQKSSDFNNYPLYTDMVNKMVFILDRDDKLAATAVLWKCTMFGSEYQRIHWVAVSPKYNGLGLCKALITKIFDIYNEFGYTDYIYLTSQTWSYKALNIYSKFGFKPYMERKPEKWLAVNLSLGIMKKKI